MPKIDYSFDRHESNITPLNRDISTIEDNELEKDEDYPTFKFSGIWKLNFTKNGF